MTDEITIIEDNGATLAPEITSPYHTEVETKAWDEGRAQALLDNETDGLKERSEQENPYTSADTMVAWSFGYDSRIVPRFDVPNLPKGVTNPYGDNLQYSGTEATAWQRGYWAGIEDSTNPSPLGNVTDNPYDDVRIPHWAEGYEYGSYVPAPFNPTDIDGAYPTEVFLEVYVPEPDREFIKALRLVWRSYAADKPAWALNRVEDRSVQIQAQDARRFRQTTMNHTHITPEGTYDLPCPPYEYEYLEGGMSIQSGAFKKWGSKDDWEDVLQEMQQKVEDMPSGLNVEDAYIEVSVTVKAETTYNVSVPISALVETDDGSVYTGSMDGLESDVDSALDGWGDREMEQYVDMDEVDWSYADTKIDGFEAEDTGYDIRNGVSEV